MHRDEDRGSHAFPTSFDDLFEQCEADLPGGYVLLCDRIHERVEAKDEGDPPTYNQICSPFVVTCRACDEDGNNWSREIRFLSEWGEIRTALVKETDLVKGSGFIEPLVNAGFLCGRGQVGKVAKLIQGAPATTRKTSLSRPGWHLKSMPAYRLPSGLIIGADPALIAACFVGSTFAGSFREKAKAWRTVVAPEFAGNRILIVSACLPLTGPLLRLVGTDGFALHLDGSSSVGKSTAARLANSVFSTADLHTAESTPNGWEPILALHNDGFLTLDELSLREGMAKDSYSIANGKGKLRAKAGGSASEQANWKLIVLTTGEISPAEATKGDVHKGQLVRHITLPVQGHRQRLFDTIGSHPDAQSFTDHLKAASQILAESLGPAFVEALCGDLENIQIRAQRMLREHHQSLIAFTAPRSNGSMHQRILLNFALIQTAGQLAIEFGLAPWTEKDLVAATRHAALRALRFFDNPDFFKVMKHDLAVESLWMHLEENENCLVTKADAAGSHSDIVGWIDEKYAYITRQQFDAWYGGPVAATEALKHLAGLGYIKTGEGRHLPRKVPGWITQRDRAIFVDRSKVPL